MAISSMTGFARASGSHGDLHWHWEVKSVNGKALDVRCRLPSGFEGLEPALRNAAVEAVKRGSLQVGLVVSGALRTEEVRLNQQVLTQIIAAGEQVRGRIGGGPLRADQLLGLRGVLDVVTPDADEAALAGRDRAMIESFAGVILSLVRARQDEGARLAAVLRSQLSRIKELASAARNNPARTPEAIKRRLADQVGKLLEASTALDPARLHQEAAMLFTRSDIQEELDRLDSHLAAAGELLASADAIGRKFDFLAQEFNREANTLCSKAIDSTLTAIGLDLKTVIDQMREQIQNIE